ncbi:hypothetical protein AMELA_G00037580 [Ameiurus melas]|uniref:Uncharacterized protein n=1 Tax=Ameiurus melas TaxID=219545 RepID=A0A7J6BAJ9_AMEME|nr:hypothetical protein AMELA_G00037580 [Ameiurus melas]
MSIPQSPSTRTGREMLKETQKSEDMNVDMLKYTQKDLDTALEMTRKQVEENMWQEALRALGTPREWRIHVPIPVEKAALHTLYAEREAALHTLHAEREAALHARYAEREAARSALYAEREAARDARYAETVADLHAEINKLRLELQCIDRAQAQRQAGACRAETSASGETAAGQDGSEESSSKRRRTLSRRYYTEILIEDEGLEDVTKLCDELIAQVQQH